MKIAYQSDFPVTDTACQQATGKTLKQWYDALDQRGGTTQKRRDAINWLHAEMNKDVWWCTTAWVEYERAKGIVNKKDGLIEGYNICVTKTIAAPLPEVYAAFTDASLLSGLVWQRHESRRPGGRHDCRQGWQHGRMSARP